MPPKREGYLKEAAAQFLEGLPHRTPAEAIEAGARTLLDWCETLERVRQERGVTDSPLREGRDLDPEA